MATAGVGGGGGRRGASCILGGGGAEVLPEARIVAITKMRIWAGWLVGGVRVCSSLSELACTGGYNLEGGETLVGD